jgi:hypothetical protein
MENQANTPGMRAGGTFAAAAFPDAAATESCCAAPAEPCCTAEAQEACCDPADKAGCCGTGGGCGCQ